MGVQNSIAQEEKSDLAWNILDPRNGSPGPRRSSDEHQGKLSDP